MLSKVSILLNNIATKTGAILTPKIGIQFGVPSRNCFYNLHCKRNYRLDLQDLILVEG